MFEELDAILKKLDSRAAPLESTLPLDSSVTAWRDRMQTRIAEIYGRFDRLHDLNREMLAILERIEARCKAGACRRTAK